MIDAPDIGLATLTDAQSIALISRDEIEHGLRWDWRPPRVRRAIEDRDTNVVVARHAASVIGFALMKYRSDDAHLLLLGVVPQHRRRGVATAMMSWLEETLRVAGIAAIQVEVRASNRAALAFYAKLGYEQVNATLRYYQGIETALHLVKELASPGEKPP
jgi:[ribosomal protein S18]-alanine N-acetyltransferase